MTDDRLDEAPASEEQTAPAAEPQEAQPEIESAPRPQIRGIHPELRCQCEECAPEYTELQFFTPEEAAKTKGQSMLFCGHTGRKYFAPAPELSSWVAEHAPKKSRRSDG
ncbi:MAG TPA: hypothetical protein V6D47_03120 [Oscillatoriaceae cyanobacterium]